MKRNTIMAAGTALVLAFSLNNLQAQNDTPAPAPVPAAPTVQPVAPLPGQPPARGPRPMPSRMRQPRMAVQMALRDLRQVKMVLQGAQEDFGGHKDTAIEACDKAMAELEEVMKAIPQRVPPQRPGQPPGSVFQNNLTPIPPAGANPPPAAPNAPPAAPPQP